MNRIYKFLPFLFSIPLTSVLLSNSAMAETIIYDGTQTLVNPSAAIGTGAPPVNNSLTPITDSSNNSVTIPAGTWSIGGGAYGGISIGGNFAKNNQLSISGGTVAFNATGGWSYDNQSFNNSVIINGGRVSGKVYGGWVDSGSETADFNKVFISGTATIGGNIYGGYTQSTNGAVQNSVTINGGTFLASVTIVAGGYNALSINENMGFDAPVRFNSVTITDGTLANAIVYGGRMQGNNINDSNSVTIRGGTVKSVIGGENIQGAGTVAYNKVLITGGRVTNNVIGGRVGILGGAVNENTVTIGGGTVNGSVYGGQGDSGAVTNNIVSMFDGTVDGDVYGASVNTGTATGNIVNMSGGTVNGDIFAALTGSGAATANAVNLSGGTVTGTVHGSNNPLGTWTTDGNSLNVTGSLSTVGGVQLFQNASVSSGSNLNVLNNSAYSAEFFDLTNNGLISFYNNSPTQDVASVEGSYSGSGQFGLEVLFGETATATDADSIVFTNYPGAPVRLTFKALPGSSASTLDTPVLIATITGGGPANAFVSADAGYGSYAYEISQTGNQYFLKLADIPDPSLGKVHSEAAAAGTSQLAQASSMFLIKTMTDAVMSTNGNGWALIPSFGGSNQRVKTGSHADISGMNGSLALAYSNSTPYAVGVFGDFFEGKYDTHNEVYTSLGRYDAKAKGDISSYGIGVFGQYKTQGAQTGMSPLTPGMHLEASARLGRNRLEFEDNSTVDRITYTKKNMYYGASLGGGYVFSLNNKTMLDTYAHTIWTHEAAKTVNDNLNQRLRFKGINSLRVLAGGRLSVSHNKSLSFYADASLDWEAMGKVKVLVDSHEVDHASLKGLTGVGELGVLYRLKDRGYLDMKVFGNVGQRRGGGGMISARFDF